jgi:hypothetical protein
MTHVLSGTRCILAGGFTDDNIAESPGDEIAQLLPNKLNGLGVHLLSVLTIRRIELIEAERLRSLAGPAARNVMSRKTVMPARSSATS